MASVWLPGRQAFSRLFSQQQKKEYGLEGEEHPALQALVAALATRAADLEPGMRRIASKANEPDPDKRLYGRAMAAKAHPTRHHSWDGTAETFWSVVLLQQRSLEVFLPESGSML